MVEAALCSGWKFTHSLSSISSSRITVTRRCVSFISPNGVTDPGVAPGPPAATPAGRTRTEEHPTLSRERPRSARLSAGMTTSQMPPFRSFMNRFLPCRPGILSCQDLPCSTVKNGGCSTVLCSMPRRSNIAKRSADVAGMVPDLQEPHSRINRLRIPCARPPACRMIGTAILQGACHDLRLSSCP